MNEKSECDERRIALAEFERRGSGDVAKAFAIGLLLLDARLREILARLREREGA